MINPNKTILILDLDGVLITNPTWKADEIDADGYSKFNTTCITNLNQLLKKLDVEIWLSSTRRTTKTIAEFNQIFKNRNIKQKIQGFVPMYENCKNRKDEILRFLSEYQISKFLILDDDKSLNGLAENYKQRLILTDLLIGFDNQKLKETLNKIE